jgi:hypothetical protein
LLLWKAWVIDCDGHCVATPQQWPTQSTTHGFTGKNVMKLPCIQEQPVTSIPSMEETCEWVSTSQDIMPISVTYHFHDFVQVGRILCFQDKRMLYELKEVTISFSYITYPVRHHQLFRRTTRVAKWEMRSSSTCCVVFWHVFCVGFWLSCPCWLAVNGVGQTTCWRVLYLAAVHPTCMLLSFLHTLDKYSVM